MKRPPRTGMAMKRAKMAAPRMHLIKRWRRRARASTMIAIAMMRTTWWLLSVISSPARTITLNRGVCWQPALRPHKKSQRLIWANSASRSSRVWEQSVANWPTSLALIRWMRSHGESLVLTLLIILIMVLMRRLGERIARSRRKCDCMKVALGCRDWRPIRRTRNKGIVIVSYWSFWSFCR